MPGPPHVPARHVLTLQDLGAEGRALWVERFPGRIPPPPREPFVATFSTIALMTRGRGRVRQRMEQVVLRAGDIHLVPAGVERQAPEPGTMGGWLVAFDPSLWRWSGLLPEAASAREAKASEATDPLRGLNSRGLLRLRPSGARLQHMERLILQMETELRESRWGSEGVVRALFTVLLTELGREAREQAPGVGVEPGGLVREALAFIEAHCLESISLQDVAAAVDRTPSHVATAIRQGTGLTVGDWLREHRMAQARQRLLETSVSVAEVASQVGYTDVTHFIRSFRRRHGMTPRAWRENHRKGRA